jgi:tryptophan synthase alpha subunit
MTYRFVAQQASGFIYVIAVTGITGARVPNSARF